MNRTSPIYQRASRTPSVLATLQLAGTLVHEQVHNTDGEMAAARLQADFVRDRLAGVSRPDRDAAHRYLNRLDARAYALATAWRRLQAVPAGGVGVHIRKGKRAISCWTAVTKASQHW